MPKRMWYDETAFVHALPLRYRLYALYGRIAGDRMSRRIAGGSYMLRLIRRTSRLLRLSTTANLSGVDGLVVEADFADERILDVIHEIRGENPEYNVLKHLLSPGDSFVDVGANFGTFSLLASRLVGNAGHVTAIEPQPRLASMIERSLAMSGVFNCEVVQAVCAADEGVVSLFIPPDDAGRAGVYADFSARPGHARIEVEARTLDAILSNRGRGGRNVVMKIDVEGSELDVLAGATRLLSEKSPALIIEYNPWSARAAGRDPSKLFTVLRDLGYVLVTTAQAYPNPVQIPLEHQSNLVAVHKSAPRHNASSLE